MNQTESNLEKLWRKEKENSLNPNTVSWWDKVWQTANLPEVRVSHQEIAKMLPMTGNVLDVGCGPCHLFKEIKSRRPELKLTGIDYSRTAIAKGRKEGFEVIRQSVPPLPFGDKEFDIVIGDGIMEHVKQDWYLFEEMQRVGKQVILTVPENEPFDNPMMESGEHRHIYRHDDFSNFETKKMYDMFPRILAYSPGVVEKQTFKKVYLAFSGYAGFTEAFVTSLLSMYQGVTNAILATPKEGKNFEFKLPAYAESLPSVYLHYTTCNLNKTKDALANGLLATDCDYMMIIDADMRFPANGIHQLVLDDKDIVSGFYIRKSREARPTMGHHIPGKGIHVADDYPNNKLFDNYEENKLVLPTGFTLIKRDAIIAMRYPRFDYIQLYNNRIGTDWSFCLRATEMGFGVWADTRVKLSHIGEWGFKTETYFDNRCMECGRIKKERRKNKKRMVS